MILSVIILFVSLLIVAKGGDLFVDSSVAIARYFCIPRIVIGATIVSLATTVPELTVSATASLIGDSGIAIGNAVGSVIANIALIIGIVGVMTAIHLDLPDFKRRMLWMTGLGILVILFSLNLTLPRFLGLILLLLALTYLFVDFLSVRAEHCKQENEKVTSSVDEKSMPIKKAVIEFVIGVSLVIVGSRFLVSSAIFVAEALGIPSVIIGLTIVAVGTSLPELITGIASARKGVADLSVGNIIGANVLNLGLITGVSALIRPLSLTQFTQAYSFPWMMVVMGVFFALFCRTGVTRKGATLPLLFLYFIYIVGLIFLPKMVNLA